ncbi:MAG: ribonuclease HII [Spirochaetales bacterium]|nr:ribonuclease HII [Spirochaetales bacterium]
MKLVCGIDEAGRGPLAGPVTAACVILPQKYPVWILNDSKRLRPSQREEISVHIKKNSMAWAVGWAWPEEIDRINILNASLLAMKRAFEQLPEMPELALVDGTFSPDIGIQCRPIVKGDTFIPQIMAASILAKNARDRWMSLYSLFEPAYGFEIHKGYPTPKHRRLVNKLGMSRMHRKSFKIQ